MVSGEENRVADVPAAGKEGERAVDVKVSLKPMNCSP